MTASYFRSHVQSLGQSKAYNQPEIKGTEYVYTSYPLLQYWSSSGSLGKKPPPNLEYYPVVQEV